MVAAALLLPVVGATPGQGAFLAEGATQLPSGSEVSFAPLLLFHADSAGLQSISLRAPTLRVHVFEEQYLEGSAAEAPALLYVSGDARRHDLTSAEARLTGTAAVGFSAIYPFEGGSAQVVLDAAASLHPRDRTEVFTSVDVGGADREDAFASGSDYHQSLRDPHLLGDLEGALRYEGPLLLKLRGPDLEIRSAEGTFAVDTGTARTGGAVSHVTIRWVILEAPSASLEVRATTPWLAAARDVSSSGDGEILFRPLSGRFETVDKRFAPGDGDALVGGSFQVALEPHVAADRTLLTHVALQGDLQRTTLQAQPVFLAQRIAAASQDIGGPLLVLLAGFAATTGAGFALGALYGRRRSRRARRAHAVRPPPVALPIAPPAELAMPFTAEDCCDAGAKAASEEDWAAAAKWFGRARALAPTSARICADLAFSLSQIGDTEEALRLYAQASRLSSDGEADFNGALAALHGARPLGEIEEWLERALARTPALVMPLSADDDFKVLRGRPRFERAVRRAWEQVEGGARAG